MSLFKAFQHYHRRLWDAGTREADVTFTGHKTSVSCLAWDRAGLRLVSGSRDNTVIVWDVVAECGLARLQGHKVREFIIF